MDRAEEIKLKYKRLRSEYREPAEDLQNIIHEEFVRWLGADIAGLRAKYTKIAQEVWDAYEKHDV